MDANQARLASRLRFHCDEPSDTLPGKQTLSQSAWSHLSETRVVGG
ncbi:MAG: hypothetical protein HY228_00190, partial [Candidatus Yonathbacteria bacterium]|nr:hypothetical protein [Candidatus Yonathbacteria bacterium]